MPYVMVPVPEEHVEAVMQFVIRAIQKASVEPWDEASIQDLYHGIDEVSRSLVAFVARSAVEGKELDQAEAARQIQMTPREVNGIVNELTSMNKDENRPTLITTRSITVRLPNGRSAERRVLAMEPEVADLVQAAEQAEIAEARQALQATQGSSE
jgi:hypothetical protein